MAQKYLNFQMSSVASETFPLKEEWLEDDSQKWYTDGTRTLQEVGVEIVGAQSNVSQQEPTVSERNYTQYWKVQESYLKEDVLV
ncbi:hypothetical protein EVAR_101107_1 [Eumeta japonica]|uniref:Uncharacterized protein n=1 Tax=Eumeta variegata TaxID=151549 RepID=A0A4C1TT79_EUMVA|nr:hypothetical protein EVAR_101107_1 [Eumeta japonica]